MHLAHLFDFVKVNNKAAFIRVVFLDTFPAKNSVVV
jgi:hypothetical protein